MKIGIDTSVSIGVIYLMDSPILNEFPDDINFLLRNLLFPVCALKLHFFKTKQL